MYDIALSHRLKLWFYALSHILKIKFYNTTKRSLSQWCGVAGYNKINGKL